MDKSKQEALRDISNRLRLSDRTLWDGLTQEEKDAVVDTYYNLSSIEKVGLAKVLEDNRGIRRDFGNTGIGLMLGLFGGAAANVLMKYAPDSKAFDAFVVLSFVLFFVWFARMINKMSVEGLKEDRVLEHLVKDQGPRA